MKSTKTLVLTVLLIWSSYSIIGFAIVGPFTTSAFNCLLSTSEIPNDQQYAIIRGYQNSHSPAGIDPNALQTMQNSYAAGWTADLYVQICRGSNATSQVNLVYSDILFPLISSSQASFDNFFYIKVEPTSNPDCSWAGYSQSDNCNYLKEAVNAVHSIGWSPAIFSTAHIWALFFGSSCDTFATDTGSFLWYVDYNSTGNVDSTPDFSDFVSFGGWTAPLVKQVSGSVTIPLLCGNTAWHAFLDQIYYP